MTPPRVSIGLPVYNGERFVSEAIRSLLGQTYEDLELIVSDNASSDRTGELCLDFAKGDSRLRYHRNPENLGAAANYSRVFELARGEYFKWAAHDDVCCPEFVERCVAALDADPGIVLASAGTVTIDESGREQRAWEARSGLDDPQPENRFAEALRPVETFPIWGLIRRSALVRTRLLGPYTSHDRPLLAELSLHGRFVEDPEPLLRHREHPGRSVRLHDFTDPRTAIAWYAPEKAGRRTYPSWRLWREYAAAIGRAPVSWRTKARCHRHLLRWSRTHAGDLAADVMTGAATLPILGRRVQAARRWRSDRRWTSQTRQAAREMEDLVRPGATLVLLDEGTLDVKVFARWPVIPFPEANGVYAGPPATDREVVAELRKVEETGADYLAVFAPAYWWLDYYPSLGSRLFDDARCVCRSPGYMLFDLRDGARCVARYPGMRRSQ